MRKITLLLTLLLVFTLAAGGSLQGYSLQPPASGGATGENPTDTDDHPWGGDETSSGNTATAPSTPSLNTAFLTLNLFINQFVNWLVDDAQPKTVDTVSDQRTKRPQSATASSTSDERVK